MNNISYKQDLAIYCATHGNNVPIYQYEKIEQKNMYCGAYNLTQEQKDNLPGWVFDDYGQQISELNPFFSELTAIYNAWKNYEHEFKGVCHYRRMFVEDELCNIKLKPNTLYVNKPLQLGKSFVLMVDLGNMLIEKPTSVYEQFFCLKSLGLYGMNLLGDLCKTRKIPIKYEHFLELHTYNELLHLNMFIADHKTYDKLCSILFESVFALHENSYHITNTLDDYNKRLVGFVSERLMTIIYNNMDYYLPTVKLDHVNIFMK